MLLFNPVTYGDVAHVIDLDKYYIARRFGSKITRSKLIMEYVCNPLDMTVEHARHFMKRLCDEIDPSKLSSLDIGTHIAYQRKDTGKLVKTPVIIKHMLSAAKNHQCTLVGFENNGTYLSKSRRQKIANGQLLAPTRFTNQTWVLSSNSIDRLFIVRSEIDVLQEELSQAKKEIKDRDTQIEKLTVAVNTMKNIMEQIMIRQMSKA